MFENPVSAIDVLYDISTRFARVTTTHDLLEAIAAYPRHRAAARVVIFRVEPDLEAPPRRLYILDSWSEGNNIEPELTIHQRLTIPSALVGLEQTQLIQSDSLL